MSKLTQKTILATRRYFADNALACIADAKAGVFHVNDLVAYTAERRVFAGDSLAGKHDSTFTFRQLAHYIQTGECVAFMPR